LNKLLVKTVCITAVQAHLMRNRNYYGAYSQTFITNIAGFFLGLTGNEKY